MSNPTSIRIPYEAPDAKIKATQEAARTAEADVRRLEKALMDAAKTGKMVSGAQVDALGAARKRADVIRDQLQKNRDAERVSAVQSRQLGQASHAFRGLQRVFGDVLWQKLARGEKIESTDILRTAAHSERLVTGAAKAMGVDTAAARLHPLVATAVELAMHKQRIDKASESDADFEIGLINNYTRGTVGESTLRRTQAAGSGFGGAFGRLTGGEPMKEAAGTFGSMGDKLAGLSEDNLDAALKKQWKTAGAPTKGLGGFLENPDKALGLDEKALGQVRDKQGDIVTAQQIKGQLEVERKKISKMTGYTELNGAEEKQARTETAAKLNFDKAVEEALQKALEKQEKNIPMRNKARDDAKAHFDHMYRMRIDLENRRVADSPTD